MYPKKLRRLIGLFYRLLVIPGRGVDTAYDYGKEVPGGKVRLIDKNGPYYSAIV